MLRPLVEHLPDLHFYMDTCVADLCLLFQGGGSHTEANELLGRLVVLVRIHVNDKMKTRGEWNKTCS